MIDTHCHLADRKFERDLAAVLRRAREAGVDRCVCIADSLPESRKCLAIAEKYPEVSCAIGVHPHHAKTWMPEDSTELKRLARSSSNVRAIGEIGLDYHYDFSPREDQRRAFEAQLKLAEEIKLPVVMHCREAIADVRGALKGRELKKIVLHCCTEAWEDVEELVAQGIMLSFTGIATYPQADAIRRVIRLCPLPQMMVETDAPYLAPGPFRGKRNEPAYVVEVAKLIARIKNVPLIEVDRVTTANAVAFFGLPS